MSLALHKILVNAYPRSSNQIDASSIILSTSKIYIPFQYSSHISHLTQPNTSNFINTKKKYN